jgi:hypothetical protein
MTHNAPLRPVVNRAPAEDLLYDMVFRHFLPQPCWNVDLHLPGGLCLGRADAYWPEQSFALELDTRADTYAADIRTADARSADVRSSDVRAARRRTAGDPCARKRELLARLGITLLHLTPWRLRVAPAAQAAIVRTALMTAAERGPAEPVSVTPR